MFATELEQAQWEIIQLQKQVMELKNNLRLNLDKNNIHNLSLLSFTGPEQKEDCETFKEKLLKLQTEQLRIEVGECGSDGYKNYLELSKIKFTILKD